jgi:hypothetical protein
LERPGAAKPSSENSVAPTPSKVPVMYTAYTWVGINRGPLLSCSPLPLSYLRFPHLPNPSPRSYSIMLTWHFIFSFRHCYFFPFIRTHAQAAMAHGSP